LPSQTVFDFSLNGTTNSAISFQAYLIKVMDYFLAGKDQQQTNQPNNLACG